MGSVVEETEEERLVDVENTIFVAVGKDSQSTLGWAVQNFAGKKICLLHVHRPTHLAAFMNGKLSSNKLKQHAVKAFWELDRQKMHKLLNQYLLILAQAGVQADKVWIETDNIEKGIIEIIAQHNIRWLVMGAAADDYYSKYMSEIKSKKAIFVCQQAPVSCHIWFSCKGCLIYTRNRGCGKDKTEIGITPPLLLLNSDIGTEQSEYFSSESVLNRQRSLNCARAKDANEWEGTIKRFSSQLSLHSTWPAHNMFGSLKSTLLLPYEEEKIVGEKEFNKRLEQAMTDAKNLKWEAFKESVKRWKAEEDAMEAVRKAKASESLCTKEMIQRKEMEEMLERKKQEVETMKNQRDELTKELRMVQDQRPILESQMVKSNCTVKELEDKIISAVELLISFKEKRDELRIEHGNAIRKVEGLRNLVEWKATTRLGKPQFFALTFSEINDATNNFDPSWKIGEGSHGSVYKGFLRHMHVAIKMLPSYGSQGHLEFQHEVEVLSRVRHPNLTTLIGTCPESRSVIYEYLKNGNLEDCLTCRKNTSPLPWQTRIHIAAEICSALIFLHSNKPYIVHGNLKPTNVLLGTNFVSKLSDLGISRLSPQDENPTNSSTLYNNTNLKDRSAYIDPEYLKTGEITPKSDVYSFGVILLRLLTGRPVLGIVKSVKCALEKGNFNSVLDFLAGEWPLEQAKQLAHLALRCCEENRLNRPDLVSDVWSVLEPMKTCIASASTMNSKEHHRVPSHFVCPIFQEVMKDPHIAADGFTYEADAIKGWLNSGHNTSPMTNLKLSHCNLIPNYALHYAIQEWQHQS